MEKNDSFSDEIKGYPQKDEIDYSQKIQRNKFSKPMIAGFLLIIAGFLAIFNWIQLYTIDAITLDSVIDISQLRDIDPTITTESLVSFIKNCAIVGFIISIFTILGGFISIKRKLWGIALTCSIIGIFSIGIIFTSSLLSFIAMILLIISRKEY
jgi:hypothetical protein